jgi:hypothetical protein
VIAEKFQAVVVLGRANSRMKDFHDIWVLKHSFGFSGDMLARAIAATFARRKTEIPTERPDALTRVFRRGSAQAAATMGRVPAGCRDEATWLAHRCAR